MLFYRFFLILILVVGFTESSLAKSSDAQKSLGTFGAWKAYSYEDRNQPVCYMVQPIENRVKNKRFKRGAAYLMITHRPAESSKDVISYTAGYNFKAASEVKLHIDKNIYSLFTAKDTAWSRFAGTDHAIATAIRNGASVKLTSQPDTKIKELASVSDTLDPKGAVAAYKAISKACGFNVDEPAKKKPTADKKQKPAEKKKPKARKL